MIEKYNTLIQFLAAIYVTLSFDTWLFKSLWSMKYVEWIKNKLKERDLDKSSNIFNQLKYNIESNAATIEKHSRVRGVYLLLYCIFYMWNAGYAVSDNSMISFSIITILVLFIFLFVKLWQNRLLWSVIIWSFFVLIYIVLNFGDLSICMKYNVISSFVNSIGILGTMIVLFPLVFQVFINWLYTENYYYILIDKIRTELDLFEKARACDRAEDVPDEYNQAFSQAYFDQRNDGETDTIVSNLMRIQSNRLNEVTQKRSFCDLLIYAITHIMRKREDKELFTMNIDNMNGEIVPSN